MSYATETKTGNAIGPSGHVPRAGWFQLRLRTLFLLTAAVGVWLAAFNHYRHIAWLRERIAAMRPVARELMILDPRQIAIVQQEQHWYDEHRWEVHLPEGSNYRLCLATREIDGKDLAPIVASSPLSAGRHLLELHQQRGDEMWKLRVTDEDEELLTATEPKAWNSGGGSSGGGFFSQSTQLPLNKPVILFRRRFHGPAPAGGFKTPTGPTDGILLWIESVDESARQP